MIEVRLELDSVGPSGKRLSTWVLKYHRYIHSEVMTHRCWARNAASTRSIPAAKFRKAVEDDPAMPVYWGKHQSGMQAEGELDGDALAAAKRVWLDAAEEMTAVHRTFENLKLHKQVANRILEPWAHITIIATATEFGGWFKLRDHRMAQPEIRELAHQMRELYRASTPRALKEAEWHLPLLPDRKDLEAEYPLRDLLKISTGRVARVSYLTHDGQREPVKDIELHDRLLNTGNDPGHFSPFEHIAQALSQQEWNERCLNEYREACRGMRCFNPMKLGNLIGWNQYRKWIAEERNLDESGFSYDWRKP